MGASASGPQPVGGDRLVLLLGGARSGKSALAVRWGRSYAGPVTFIATGQAGDDEMAQRIARHRAARPSDWTTVEEPHAVAAAVAAADPQALVIVDCLTLWLSNVLAQDHDDILASAMAIVTAAQRRDAATVVISNEVGWGIVPADPVTRRYRDLLGEINTAVAAHADRALLMVAGRALALGAAPEVF
jgi:adenosylcobinamide kinase/adenosylcobinamide-phosphate guanylyltransferase